MKIELLLELFIIVKNVDLAFDKRKFGIFGKRKEGTNSVDNCEQDERQNYESPFINYVFKYLNYLQLISIGQSFNNVIKVLFKYIIVFLSRIHALTSQSKFADQIERLSMDRLIDIEPNLRKTVSGTKLYRWAGFPPSLADYFHRYVKITYIISVTFNLINVNHVNCRPKKKLPPQKGVQLRLDVVYLMQREREREFARFDRPSNYENKDEREARKKEGKNKLQGNKRGGTNVRKGGEQVHGAFERNDPLVACEPPFFATFSIYALPRIVSILLCSLQASVFFKGILNYDESREIKRYFTFLWYILKYIGTTEKFQNIRLFLSVIVKNVDLAFNKRKFEIFVSWLQYCDDYSNITSFDQFKILISMKARMYNFLSKILDVIHLSIFLHI